MRTLLALTFLTGGEFVTKSSLTPSRLLNFINIKIKCKVFLMILSTF